MKLVFLGVFIRVRVFIVSSVCVYRVLGCIFIFGVFFEVSFVFLLVFCYCIGVEGWCL